MNLPDPNDAINHIIHIDPYIEWAWAWVCATWDENSKTIAAIGFLTGWQIKSPAAILEWMKNRRRKDGLS